MRRWRRRILPPLAVLLAALLAVRLADAQTPIGTRRPDTETATPLRELGSELYAANCSTCHGIAGRGVTARAPQRGVGNVTGLGPSLIGVGAGTVDLYLRTGYMPLKDPHDQPTRSAPSFDDHEIKALIAYVTSLGALPGPPIPDPHPEKGNLAKGLELFTEHCAGCHQVVAQGGIVSGARVPPLEDDGPVTVAEAVRAGPFLMPKFRRSQISDDELNSIIRYVQLARHPVNRGGWPIGNIGPVPEGLVTWLIGVALFIAVCMIIGERFKRE